MGRPSAHEDVFRAIADPTRRALLDRLREEGERTVGQLADEFDTTLPAVSQHLKVLRDAGLVRVTQNGRQRLYRIEPAPLRDVGAWISHFERFWETRLDELGLYLDRQAKQRKDKT
jgi:DNA-binding transcriptional ArsR family regulator